MRSSSISGFDLRDRLDSLREAFGPWDTGRPGTEKPRHGDIRDAILTELGNEPMHGYQIIEAIAARSGGAWKPSAGSVYPTLQLLADEALVSAAQVGERKVYSLTEAGRKAAAAITDSDQASGPRGRRNAEGAISITKAGARLAQALAQVAQSGTPDQSERTVALIDEARRKVYAILAED